MNNPPPRHVAIIMDGNGRWAQRRGLARVAGHRAGVEAVRRVVELSVERGIEALTLFAFSTENWQRPPTEVRLLMQLFSMALRREARALRDAGVRLRVIGDRQAFAPRLREAIAAAEQSTAGGDRLALNVAANYGGRWDIAQACRTLADEVARGVRSPESIDSDAVAARVCLADLPEPDLFIRTGGEQRISNFLIWQLAYTELYFTDCLWPDFDAAELDAALASYAGRQRRFGRTAEQVRCPAKAG